MQSKPVLVVTLNRFVDSDTIAKMRNTLLKEMEEGLVILPVYAKAFIIPSNVSVVVTKEGAPNGSV